MNGCVVDYTASELIVRDKHSCLDNPTTIEEVRRILLEHLTVSGQTKNVAVTK